MRNRTFILVSQAVFAVFSIATPSVFSACLTTPNDCIPDFGATPTITSVANGPWSSAATWSLSRVPTNDDAVAIAAGTNVTYDVSSTARIKTISILSGGKLAFRTDINTKLMVQNLLVKEGGELEIGTIANTVATDKIAEVIFLDQPLETVNDPDQFGNGLIALGKVTIHGAPKDKTFVLTSAEPLQGQSLISVSESLNGWRNGDEIAIPDTRALNGNEVFSAFVPQWERKIITVGANSVSLNSALVNNHKGWHRPDNSVEFLPHIANLTRNVRFSSENPNGVRGHILFTHRAAVDVRYAEFRNLGRTTEAEIDPATNHDGRFPLHMYHLWGPVNPSNTGYQFKLIGNAVIDGMKWGLVLWDSDFGRIERNVVAFMNGAGYVVYGQSSGENEFEANMGVAVTGHRSPRAGYHGDGDGRGGEVFYTQGWHNTKYINNVAASGAGMSQEIVSGCGYKFVTPPGGQGGLAPVALRRGADKKNGVQGVDYKMVDLGSTPITDFIDNQAYGTMATGLTIWHIGYDEIPYGQSIIKDLLVWNMWDQGVFAYPIRNFLFDGLVVRGDPYRFYGSWGWDDGDYQAIDVTFKNADIRGTAGGIKGTAQGGTISIENSYMQVTDYGVTSQVMYGPGAGNPTTPRTTIIKDTKIDAWPGKTIQPISMGYHELEQGRNYIVLDQLFVYNYQRTAGVNFQVFYKEQRPDYGPIPVTTRGGGWPGAVGAPEPGLTNLQLFNKYPNGITVNNTFYPHPIIAGALATCTDETSHPEIFGYVCAISDNQFPIANAGTNQTIIFPNGVTLDGTTADDGKPAPPATVTAKWSLASGPGTVTFANPNVPDTTATFSAAGIYILRLTADDSQLSSSDDVTITVKPAGSPNDPPAVSAGIDQTVGLKANLDGFASDDGLPNPPGVIIVTWSQVSGPGTVTFGNPTAAKTTAAFPTPGVYVLRLTANDSQAFRTDDVNITVTAGSQGNNTSLARGRGVVRPPNVPAVLPCASNVRIYRARTGEDVDAVLTVNGDGLFEWRGKRTGGDAAAGMYGYKCNGPDGKEETGKLVLVK